MTAGIGRGRNDRLRRTLRLRFAPVGEYQAKAELQFRFCPDWHRWKAVLPLRPRLGEDSAKAELQFRFALLERRYL